MAKNIIADIGFGQTRVALLEDDELIELFIERPYPERLLGNIYRAKVDRVLPGMHAAFIDIGYEKKAFLYAGDIITPKIDGEELEKTVIERNIDSMLKAGQEITVQVIKEPMGTKGPRVTTNLTLPGRYVVLMPNLDYVGVSRRIESEAEKERLKKIAEAIKPEGMGIIMRTAAEGISEDEFVKDVNFLIKLWEKIRSGEKKGNVPRILYKDLNLLYKSLRDMFTEDVDKFIINDEEEYQKVLEFMDMMSPKLKTRVELFLKDYDIFEFYHIESAMKKAVARKVWLKSGGYIIIDKTEALVVIDVNTGKFVGKKDLEDTVLKTNLEAAAEIAKQLRLRDIGGIIIIDFIDMHVPKHQQMVLNALKNELKKDRTKTTVVGITGLGLVEMTRKRVRQNLDSTMSVDCYNCGGTGSVEAPANIAYRAEKQLIEYIKREKVDAVQLELSHYPAEVFKANNAEILNAISRRYKVKINLEANSELRYDEIRIKRLES